MINDSGIEIEKKNDKEFVFAEVKKIMSEVVDEKLGISEEQKMKLVAIRKEGNNGGIKDDRIFVRNKLARALLATYDMIDFQIEMDGAKTLSDGRIIEGSRIAEKGVMANMELGNFFLSINQKFALTDEESGRLFDEVFGNHNFSKDLKGVKLEGFPRGVLAVVMAFLHLKNSLSKRGKFRMSTTEEDLHHGTDLVFESEDESVRYFYDIKSGGRKVKEIAVCNIADLAKLKMIEGGFSDKEIDKRAEGHKRIADYLRISRQLNSKVNCEAFAVIVPTIAG